MGKLFRILSWLSNRLFPDRRSEWEKKRERQFIDAVNRLKNFHVSDRGCLSIDPEELRDQILESREQLKHLVDPVHRRLVAPNPSSQPVPPENINDARSLFRELIIWRCLDGRARRYICLQGLRDERFSVAYADYFATEYELVEFHVHAISVAKHLLQTDPEHVWFGSLNAAMDAYDAPEVHASRAG